MAAAETRKVTGAGAGGADRPRDAGAGAGGRDHFGEAVTQHQSPDGATPVPDIDGRREAAAARVRRGADSPVAPGGLADGGSDRANAAGGDAAALVEAARDDKDRTRRGRRRRTPVAVTGFQGDQAQEVNGQAVDGVPSRPARRRRAAVGGQFERMNEQQVREQKAEMRNKYGLAPTIESDDRWYDVYKDAYIEPKPISRKAQNAGGAVLAEETDRYLAERLANDEAARQVANQALDTMEPGVVALYAEYSDYEAIMLDGPAASVDTLRTQAIRDGAHRADEKRREKEAQAAADAEVVVAEIVDDGKNEREDDKVTGADGEPILEAVVVDDRQGGQAEEGASGTAGERQRLDQALIEAAYAENAERDAAVKEKAETPDDEDAGPDEATQRLFGVLEEGLELSGEAAKLKRDLDTSGKVTDDEVRAAMEERLDAIGTRLEQLEDEAARAAWESLAAGDDYPGEDPEDAKPAFDDLRARTDHAADYASGKFLTGDAAAAASAADGSAAINAMDAVSQAAPGKAAGLPGAAESGAASDASGDGEFAGTIGAPGEARVGADSATGRERTSGAGEDDSAGGDGRAETGDGTEDGRREKKDGKGRGRYTREEITDMIARARTLYDTAADAYRALGYDEGTFLTDPEGTTIGLEYRERVTQTTTSRARPDFREPVADSGPAGADAASGSTTSGAPGQPGRSGRLADGTGGRDTRPFGESRNGKNKVKPSNLFFNIMLELLTGKRVVVVQTDQRTSSGKAIFQVQIHGGKHPHIFTVSAEPGNMAKAEAKGWAAAIFAK